MTSARLDGVISPPLCCPRCKRPLRGEAESGATDCPSCDVTFPRVHGLPILVNDPSAYLAGSYLALSRTRSQLVGAIAELEGLEADPALAYRHAVFRDVAGGLRTNLALLDAQRSRLRAVTAPLQRLAARASDVAARVSARVPVRRWPRLARFPAHWPTGYNFDAALEYLRNDWSGTPEGAAQVAVLGGLLEESLARFCGPSSDAVYLGAGLGRHAFEGAKVLGSVLAVELSFAAADLMASVREAPVSFCMTNWHGAATAAEIVARHRATLLEPLPRNAAYVVADSLRLPVADASVDAVVAVFFTDVVPAPTLLPEVRRVLRPRGVFLHLGPLHYHFKSRAYRLAQDELRHLLHHRYGFDVEQDDPTFELPYMDGPWSMRTVFRVWRFAARRRTG